MAQERIEVEFAMDDGSIKKGFATIKKEGDKTSNSLSSSYKKLAGIIAGIGLGLLFKKAISEALNAESALTKFNLALRNAGAFSEEASKRFQKFSSALQDQTGISDDIINQNASLLVSIGNLTGQGLERATKAALDFSAATGKDLNMAFDLVSKAASGQTEALGRYGITVDQSIPKSERFTAVLDTLEKKFGGVAAELASSTFQGGLNRLSANLNDVFETLGKFITESPQVRASIAVISDAFRQINLALQGISGKFIGDLIKDFADLTIFIVKFVGPPIEIVIRTFVTGLRTIKLAFDGLAVGVSGVANIIARITGKMTAETQAEFEKNKQILSGTWDALSQSAESNFNTNISGSINKWLIDYRQKIESAKKINADLSGSFDEVAAKITPQIQSIGQAFSAMSFGFKMEALNLAKTSQQVFQQIGKEALSGIGSGVGNAFAAFGRALVKGENALEAFVGAFLNSIGQQAVASGTRFILEGIAYQFVPGFQGVGAAMIAAGATLATFGGALTALTTPGPTATAGGGVAGGPAAPIGVEVLPSPEELERESPRTGIVVNIQGDVLDSDETGLRIVNIIQRNFDQTGSTIVGLA